MNNFEYCNRTRIIFGADQQKRVGRIINDYTNSKVLLLYGEGSIKKNGLYDQVIESLKQNNVDYVELSGVKPNPRLSLVRDGIKLCRENNIGFILAVGGGSVIDTAKAIGLGSKYDGDVWDFYIGKAVPKASIPNGNILTIPAAGSETGANTVISDEESHIKCGCKNELNRPMFSIMNPELYYSLPKNQVANGITDIISHMFERYFTKTTGNDLMDEFLEAGIRTVMRNAYIVMKDQTNYDAWAQISLAGTFAHNDLLQMGRETDWATHALEHELSALYDIPHGTGLAVLTPAWMTYVWHENPSMFIQFSNNIMGIGGSVREPEKMINAAIDAIKMFYAHLGQPSSIEELGIPENILPEMARRATTKANGDKFELGNFKKLNEVDALSIYKLCYHKNREWRA